MRILATGDWQLSFLTLDKAKTMVDEIFRICEEQQVDEVVHTGDVKDIYNPIDVRVANFAVEVCTRFKKKKIPFYVLLGNHDRVGMHVDTQNWLPILKEAGAITFDRSGTCHRGLLFFAPYTTDKENLKLELKQLARHADPKESLLFFHEDINGCKYSVITKSQDSKINIGDLYPNRYLYCIGGHIHIPQRMLDNVYYTGSPYATDWGEANQKKGYLIVDTDKKSIKQIRTEIPGLYDPLWPGFEKSKPETWKGSEVRVHVVYDKGTSDLQNLVNKAKAKAKQDYPGAEIMVVTEFVSEDSAKTFLDESSSDEEHVAEYVKQTCWDHLTVDREKIVHYLVTRLNEVGLTARNQTRIDFLRGKGVNFLSYKRLDVDFKKPGLTVITGKNKDWLNRSNGSGKTSLLQLLPVALFGETFKGQKHDRWARRYCVEKAVAILEVKNAAGKICKIVRTRRPHKLKFFINGTDQSTGNKPKATEDLIEETLGITKQTLANAIYIDQAKTNALLMGTDSERKKVLEDLQNLERYTLGQNLVKKDLKKLDKTIGELEGEVIGAEETIKQLEDAADKIDTSNLSNLRKKYAILKAKVSKDKERLQAELDHVRKRIEKRSDAKSNARGAYADLRQEQGRIIGIIQGIENRLNKMQSIKGECPYCEQQVNSEDMQRHIVETQQLLKEHQKASLDKKAKMSGKFAEIEALTNELDEIRSKETRIEDEIRDGNIELLDLKRKVQSLEDAEEIREDLLKKVNSTKKKLELLKENMSLKKQDRVFYEYCIEAFSRKGLPAFLNALIVPKLNKAAEYYSKLFADGNIKVRFESQDGEFDVKVINSSGGENIEDQSQGEMRMASLITSFARRDVSIRSNILILDEPGDGLDAYNARRFAEAIRKIAPRFGAVFLTTHNPAIMAELDGEHLVTVVKRDGISKVED